MVYLLLAEGFEEAEALVTADLLRRAEVDLALVGLDSLTVTGAHGITVAADCLLSDAEEEMEMLKTSTIGRTVRMAISERMRLKVAFVAGRTRFILAKELPSIS